MGGLWALVVTVVCGVVHAGCVCAVSPCCFVRLTGIVHQKNGKPRHIWDPQKALDETNQTITFNEAESVGFNKLLMNLDCLWQYLAYRNQLIMLNLVSGSETLVVVKPKPAR